MAETNPAAAPAAAAPAVVPAAPAAVAPTAPAAPAVAAPATETVVPDKAPEKAADPAAAAALADDETLSGVEAPAAPTEAEKKAAADKAAEAARAAPLEIKIPEAAAGKLQPGEVDNWKAIFKEAGLDSASAQKLVDAALKNAGDPKVQEALAAASAKAADESRKQKVAADLAVSRALPNLGGANFKATIAAAKSVLAQFDGGVEVSKALKESGLEAHPAFFRFLSSIRAKISEDSTGARIETAAPAPKEQGEGQTQLQRQAGQYLNKQQAAK